jgi:TetR/AcrR family transcriptional regulator, transcriptional repressor for nem operon
VGHSAAEKATNHERIVTIASRRFRERGLQNASISEVMAEAGLTHGGFYKHFASRDALIIEAIQRSFLTGKARLEELMNATDATGLEAFLQVYLSLEHQSDIANGCPVAALGAEASRSPVARETFAVGFQRYADWVAAMLDGPHKSRRARAAAIICSIAGAIAVARSLDDPALARDMLTATRTMILTAESR